MSKTITTFIVGLGTHGRETALLLPQFGVSLAGVADPLRAGESLAQLTETADLEGVEIVANIDDLPWGSVKADVVIITAKVDMDTLLDLSLNAFERGANVLTIVEDSFDMERAFPSHYQVIDAAAKAAGKSFVSTGGGDVLWSGLVIQLTSQMRELNALNLFTNIGVDGYPEEFLKWCGIGIKPEEFQQRAEEAAMTPSVFGGVLPVIARKLGLTITSESRRFEMFTLDTPHYSETFQREIPPGHPLGRHDIVEMETAEGITLSAELVTSGVNGKDEFVARLDGFPKAELRHRLDPQHLSTDAATISRIEDVIAAQPGVISTADLPMPHFRLRLAK